jgi:hypothetical protein
LTGVRARALGVFEADQTFEIDRVTRRVEHVGSPGGRRSAP